MDALSEHDRLNRSKMQILKTLSHAREILVVAFSAHHAAHFEAVRAIDQAQQDLFGVFDVSSADFSSASERVNSRALN